MNPSVTTIMRTVEPLLVDGLPSDQPVRTEVTEEVRQDWQAYIEAIRTMGLGIDSATAACRWLIRNGFREPSDWNGFAGRRHRRLNYRQNGWPAPVIEVAHR